MAITDQQLEILNAAQVANPWWFKAIMNAAEIMIQRRAKYSGKYDPYYNFVEMHRRESSRSMFDVFLFYLDIKRSRFSATQTDFDDESSLDTWRDMLNYAALAWGWFNDKRQPEEVIPEDVNPYEKLWPVVCLDFDGLLNTYAGWTGRYEDYEPRPKTKWLLSEMRKRGWTLIICTAQPDYRLPQVAAWLEKHDLMQYVHDVTNRKPPARMYPDDRGVNFDGDEEKLLDKMDQFKAFWEKDK